MHLLQKIPGQGGGAFAAQSLQYGIVGCDGTPGSALGLQQASTFQILQGTLHGIGVDARIGGQLPHGRDTAAGRKFPRDLALSAPLFVVTAPDRHAGRRPGARGSAA